MTSILTNTGAMTALQSLKMTNKSLAETQSQISTGKKVNNASDNAATWAISKNIESDVEAFGKVSEGLSKASATVGVARNAAETTTDLLKQIKEKVVQAQTADNENDLTKLQADINSLKEQVTSVQDSAQLNGVNLVDGSQGTVIQEGSGTEGNADYVPEKKGMSVLSSVNRASDGTTSSASIGVEAFNLGITDITDGTTTLANLTVVGDDGGTPPVPHAETALGAIDDMIKQASDAAAAFGTAQNQLDTQAEFVSKLSDSMEAGMGALVDADMEEVSARLTALQTQQQLGVQSLGIANQAPQSVLSLFG